MPNSYIDVDLLQYALIGLEHRKTEISQAIAKIRNRLHGAALTVPTKPNLPTVSSPKHRNMSAAAKKRMSLLMKRRWAKVKKSGKKRLA